MAREGWRTIGLARRPVPGYEYRPYDLSDPTCGPDLLRGVDTLVHAAYIKRDGGTDAVTANVAGAKALLAAAAAAKVAHVIFLSSLSARAEAASQYGRQKFEIEQLFLAVGGTALRAGLVLGNGGLFATLRDHLLAGRPIPLFAGGQQPIQTIHIDDLITAIAKVVIQRTPGRFVIAEAGAQSYRQFYVTLGLALRTRVRFVRVPLWIAKSAIGLAENFRLKLPITRDNLLGLESARIIPSQTDLDRLGIRVRSATDSLRDLAGPIEGPSRGTGG